MSSKKRIVRIAATAAFLISFTILTTELFVIPPDAGQEYYLDKIFYYSTFILFWVTAPYLLSILVRKIIWKSEFANNISAALVGKIEDSIVIALYLFSLGIVLIKLFSVHFSFLIILGFFLIMVVAVYLRPRIMKLTKEGFILSARPFKIGDRIGLQNHNGTNSFTGKIVHFDAKSVQLKSENDTLLIVPNSQLNNYVIENYLALKRDIHTNINISLNSRVHLEQAKRILFVAAKHALAKDINTNLKPPEVLVVKISKDLVEYKINFNYSPWQPFSPDIIKDKILCNAKQYLDYAGVGFGFEETKKNILKHITIFNTLGESDLAELYESAKKTLYKSGLEIIKQGSSGSSMYVVEEGLLSVFLQTGEMEKIKVGTIAPGEFFGEMSLFTGADRAATVISDTDSMLVEISKESLKNILERKPDLVNGFGEVIAERQSINLKKIDEYRNRKDSIVIKVIANIRSFFNLK